MALSHPAAGLAFAVAIILLDQVSKYVVLSTLDPWTPVAVTSFFNLVLVWNRGVSFGILSNAGDHGPWLLTGLTLVIVAALAVWLRRERRLLSRVALWMVIAGALGNLIDRLRFGAVVDFLDFHVAGYHWPAFNVADSAISIGAVLLLADSLFSTRPVLDQAGR